MSIDKLRVGTRLVLAFGCVCVLLAASIWVGIIKASTLYDGTSYIAGKEIPKIEQSGALLEQTDTIAIALRNMMLDADEQDRRAQLHAIAEARRVSDTQVQLLREELVTESSKALLAKAMEARDAYRAGQEELLALIQAGKDEEAKTYLEKKLRPTLRNYKTALQNLIGGIKRNVDAAVRDAGDTYHSSRNLLLGLGVFAVLLAMIIGTAITRSLLKQLGGEPEYAAQVAGQIAGGNLAVEVDVARNDESSMLAAMQRMRQELARIVSQVRTGTDAINTAAGEIAAGNQELSARTEQQASALEETASSLEELTSTVRQNADNARQANAFAQSASAVAAQGGKVVAEVVDRMSAINAASRNIVEIISVIDGIAFQTNILALNAAVEAARAGEQGRGFAVVAAEVRTLAQRSAAAAKEIKGLIDNSVGQVASGSVLVDEAGATMKQIIDGIRRVTDIMGEITAASDEQSAGIEQINQAVMQMDDVTQQNAALVEEAAAASAAMQEQAATLASLVAIFKVERNAKLAVASAEVTRQVTRPALVQLNHQRRNADEFEAY